MGVVSGWLWLWGCIICGLVAHAQYSQSESAHKLRERMKLISGGGPQPPTRAPAPQQASPYMDIVYSDPKLNGPYCANARWNPRGMGQLYFLTNLFLRWILNERAYPESLISISGNSVKLGDVSEHWQEWVQFYAGPIAVIVVGVAFCLILPIALFCFCCCRCAGKCGARTQLEKRHDACKRGTLATLLLGVSVVILFGVVCAFVTNEHMKEGTDSLVQDAKISLQDADLYLSNTKLEIDNLLIDNFKQLDSQLNSLMDNSGQIVSEQLANASHAIVLSNLTDIAEGLETVKNDLRDIKQSTEQVQNITSELSEALDQTRDELLQLLRSCRAEAACRELMQLPQIRDLRVIQNFTQLPDVSGSFVSISHLVGSDTVDSIQAHVREGRQSLDNIRDEVTASVKSSLPYVQDSLKKTGEQLEGAADRMKRAISEVQNLLNHLQGKTLDQADAYIDEYAVYRYYLGLLLSCLLLLMLICVSLGLLCGICGKRPEDAYSEDVDLCTTVVGSRFLMANVWIMFLLGSAMMLVTLALFLVGTAATVGVCRPINDPTHDQLAALVDKYVDLSRIYNGKRVDSNVSQIISMCHKNYSMYTTFKLEYVQNIDEVLNYRSRYNVDEQLRRFKQRIVVRPDQVQLLSPAARGRLIKLAESSVNDIQFSKYTDQLSSAVTNINLKELATQLRSYADKLPAHSQNGYNLATLRRALKTKAEYLEYQQSHRVTAVQGGVAALKANVTNLRRHLQFNHTSMRAAIEGLMNELDSAQTYLKVNGTALMRRLVDEFSKEYIDYVDKYLHRVVFKTKNDISRCGPLSNVYNATQVAGCNKLVDPFNGFWASIGWSLLLFIPAIVLSIKLSSLYQKYDVYTAPGIYPESEYLYDAYADRDNLPLANHGDKKTNHHRRYQETYDNSGNYLQDYSAHLSRAERSQPAETRFSDVAPKNWESRGPPGYTQPSTEYERPPPYYYPGPGERA